MYATAGKYRFLCIVLLTLLAACTAEKPVEKKKTEQPPVAPKPARRAVLSPEQRQELAFPPDLISKIKLAAGGEAEPFFVTVYERSRNLKGDQGFEREKLAGFSVRTKNSDEIIKSWRTGLRVKGFLIFKSHRGYGSLPDIVSVVRGNNTYDLLKIQGTEAPNYQLDTTAIIAWLREQQKLASFAITGAGSDWVEGRFVTQPRSLLPFARKVLAFAPDVRQYGPQTADKLAARMKKTNSFLLIWD